MKSTALERPGRADTEAREVLAAAIEAANAAEAAAEGTRRGLAAMEAYVIETSGAIEVAEATLDKLLADEPELVADGRAAVDVARSARERADVVTAARNRIVDAEDSYTAAKSARERVRRSVDELEQAAKHSAAARDEAMAKVVESSVAAWIEEAERARVELYKKLNVLTEMRSLIHPWTDAHKALLRFPNSDVSALLRTIRDGDKSGDVAAAEWKAAMELLARDANAPVPSPVGGR